LFELPLRCAIVVPLRKRGYLGELRQQEKHYPDLRYGQTNEQKHVQPADWGKLVCAKAPKAGRLPD